MHLMTRRVYFRIYPFPLEYTAFSTNVYVRPSQNLPLPPRIYPTSNNCRPMRSSQNLPLPPIIYPHFQQLFYYATLPKSIPPFQNVPPFQQLYATLPETTLPSENTSPFFDKSELYAPTPPSQNISLVTFLQYSKNLSLSH